MKLSGFFAVSVGVMPLAALGSSTVNLRATRDATVSYNGILCNYDTVPCSSIPLGLENTLTTFRGNRDFRRILLGFDLPTNKHTKCVLRVPKPIENASTAGYQITAAITDNVWDEASVSGYVKKIDSTQIGSLNVTTPDGTGTIDITAACDKAAAGHKISVFVDTAFPMLSFNSIQSGSADVFTLDYTF